MEVEAWRKYFEVNQLTLLVLLSLQLMFVAPMV
jgi:hypothetical protein